MTQALSESVFHIPQHVLLREVGDELVLLNLESEKYFSLNETAVLIFNCLQDGADLQGCSAALENQYGLESAVALDDTSAVLRQLLERGLIERV